MNYVIDTHIFLWLIKEPNKISKHQLKQLQDPKNNIFITNTIFWEISLKYSTGKLDLFGFTPYDLPEVAKKLGFELIDINSQTMAEFYNLTLKQTHKDPFDRLLIYFCIQNNYILISNDRKLDVYQTQGLKFINK